MDAVRPRTASSDTAVAMVSRSDDADPRASLWDRCCTFLLLWSLAEAVSVVVYVFAGRLWGFVVAGVLLTLGFVFTCYYLTRKPQPGESTRDPRPGQLQQVNGVGVGLSQGDIEAIPAFEYRHRTVAEEEAAGGGSVSSTSSSVEECAVCISFVRDGDTVRKLPACGHAFHARCINGWLRGHATCPICRAGVKVATGDGEPASPVSAEAV